MTRCRDHNPSWHRIPSLHRLEPYPGRGWWNPRELPLSRGKRLQSPLHAPCAGTTHPCAPPVLGYSFSTLVELDSQTGFVGWGLFGARAAGFWEPCSKCLAGEAQPELQVAGFTPPDCRNGPGEVLEHKEEEELTHTADSMLISSPSQTLNKCVWECLVLLTRCSASRGAELRD